MAQHNAPQVDAATGTATTGHEWDGIQELNTPLPKWWLYLLYATIVWSIGYFVVYPSWPGVTPDGGYMRGIWNWSARGAVTEELQDLQKMRAGSMDAITKASLADIEKDPKLLGFARALGKAAFGDNCAPCHGAGGGGAKGYPNLVDDDWLWGGSADAIHQTITYGIRSGDPKAREGSMPAFGKDGTLKKEEISAVSDHVRNIAGLDKNPSPAGAKLFADNCAACHGDAGKGNLDLGAPNLTDGIWLYGSDKASIVEGLTNGRGSVMPAWTGRLDPTTIKALTVFVHTLGGGGK